MAAISSPASTADPESVSVPAAGSVAIVMWSKAPSPSTSAKLNSLAANVLVASSLIVNELFAAVGGSFTPVILNTILLLVESAPSDTSTVNVSVTTSPASSWSAAAVSAAKLNDPSAPNFSEPYTPEYSAAVSS